MSSHKGLLRTHTCGELNASHEGLSVTLCGWVNKVRDLGGLHFLDIRDKYGLTQLAFLHFKGDLNLLKRCSLESTIKATGKVRLRPEKDQNKNMKTGTVEVQVEELEILSYCDPSIPFLPLSPIEATEKLRLEHRYLDLRTPRLQEILKKRSEAALCVRHFLAQEGFVEVETPLLCKSTPEGARDYLVPSRLHLGSVYALPQSPQILKQLLMVGGLDKYFQICRCFRDEDLRGNRQPEFTQIDLEASFVTPDYIKRLSEKLLQRLFALPSSFVLPSLSFQESLNRFGTDSPDMRFGFEHIVVTDLFEKSPFEMFAGMEALGGLIKALFIPEEEGRLSRKQLEALSGVVSPLGGGGVAFFRVEGGKLSSGISKFITSEIFSELEKRGKGGNGTWLFVADKNKNLAHHLADVLRRHLGNLLGVLKEGHHFVWVDHFPLFERDDKGNLSPKHHPFTSPEDSETLLKGENLEGLVAKSYDIVCNGQEIGGGSLRIHRFDVQEKMFQVLGMTKSQIFEQFGFLMDSLRFGVPPHGGVAFGFDRLLMLLVGTDSIKDVMAFPKTSSAMDLMAKVPSKPEPSQWKELGISFKL